MAAAGKGFTVVIHRDGALESRQIRIPRWAYRTLVTLGTILGIFIVAVIVLYGPIVTAAGKAPLLQLEVNRLTRENRRVQELAQRLDEAEARYAHLRGMLGANVVPPARGDADTAPRATSDERLYVGPPFFARAPDAAGGADSSGPTVPSRWPLTVRSYRTRGLASGDSLERHAGLDLAVPVGSDVRASGGGLVGRTGSDSAYGLFVMLRHPDGYETMYGHLSRVLVQRGDRVREGQVIALTGNSGRSTAPHLHFEVRRGGRSVDPLSLVREGN
jgi:murein DD-endopeptidase MepM/ murein hydrolase activator NlpD